MHFFYGLGAFLAPIIAEPFLMHGKCTHNKVVHSSNLSDHFHTIHRTETTLNSKLEYAFWILAALQVKKKNKANTHTNKKLSKQQLKKLLK